MMDKNQIREFIAKRAALEVKDGDVVNLGIGLPTLIPSFLPEGVKCTIQSENGVLGMAADPGQGKRDSHWIDAGGGYISYEAGAASFDSATSFGMVRGGHVNVTFLGALEVDEKGDLANWIIPERELPEWAAQWTFLLVLTKLSLQWSILQKAILKFLRNAVCR